MTEDTVNLASLDENAEVYFALGFRLLTNLCLVACVCIAGNNCE